MAMPQFWLAKALPTQLEDSVDTSTVPSAVLTKHRLRRRHGRLMLVIILVLIVGGAAVFVQRARVADGGPIVTEPLIRGDLVEAVSASGKIQPRAFVDVGAQASGQLNSILVRVGDFVKQGQLLAEIDPQVQAAKVDADEAQLAQYNANLVEQEANVEYANDTLGRYAKLVESNSVARLTYDQSKRDTKTAAAKADSIRAGIKQMESTLRADRVALGYTKIFAPMSGTVVSIEAREGQTLNATYSTPQIMRISDLATMTVWTQVSEADVTRLKVGMPVYFTTLGHGDRRWTATLRQILPAPQKPPGPPNANDANASSNTNSSSTNNVVLYTALFDVDNEGGDLRPEMTAQVFFVAASVKDAVIAPVAALRPIGGDNKQTATISVIDSTGNEIQRQVEVGLRTRFQAQLLSGAVPGERVVTGRRPGSSKSSLVGFHL